MTLERDAARITEDEWRTSVVRYGTVQETLAALATMLDELLSDTGVGIGDDIEFRIAAVRVARDLGLLTRYVVLPPTNRQPRTRLDS